MCGIVGAFSFDAPVSVQLLQKGLHSLAHRGPDGEGVWLSPARSVGLAHRRLAILDLNGGQQPLFSEDRQIVAVVNGEFYGFESIRDELIQAGHTFQTKTDAEILIHLYEDRGLDALTSLRGEFAFLLWDGHTQTLYAARDRFGVKPLCYRADERGVVFASEAKGILAMGHAARWSRDALSQALGMQYLLPHQTIFEGVSQLPPGCIMVVHGRSWDIRPYWQMDFLARGALIGEPWTPSFDGVTDGRVGALFGLLKDSVRTRLRADVGVAFQLSGGLDSSLVAALAARERASPIDCFTVRFSEDFYDESAHAREVADFIGARLHLIEVGPQQMIDDLERSLVAGEGFCINTHIAAKYALHRAVRAAGFRVVLTGEGADEVFGGYAHLQQDFADTLPGSIHVQQRHSHVLGVHLPFGEGISTEALRRRLGFVPSILAAKATLGAKVCSLLKSDFVAELLRFDPAAQVASLVDGSFEGRHRAHQSMMLWARLGFAGYITKTLGDAMEMAHAVEARLPFVDHHLFAALREVPPEVLFAPPKEKMLLRQMATGLLPTSIIERTKQPFMAPPMQGHWSTFLQDLFAGRLPEFVERDNVLALMKRMPGLSPIERQAWDPALMLLVSAVILSRGYSL